MKKRDFFREHKIVIWSLEYLKTIMTDVFPELENDYSFDKPMIVHCSEIANGIEFPVVLLELIPKVGNEHSDYLYYVPEVNEIRIWLGKLDYSKASPTDICKKFSVRLEDGLIQGKVMVSKKEFCFQFKQDYNHEKEND